MTEQWGDPIVVNGVRPAWLRDGDNVIPFWECGAGWYPCEEGAPADCVADWPNVTKFRLWSDHWAYPVIAKGFTPWAGGDHAPDDWDGGPVLYSCGVVQGDGEAKGWLASNWRRFEKTSDIIGYKRKEAQMDDVPEWAIARACDECGSPADVTIGAFKAFARYIAKHEDAPIDPDMIAAREVVCGYHHDKHPESPWHVEKAKMVRSGRFDKMLEVQAAYHGIKRGRDMERGE